MKKMFLVVAALVAASSSADACAKRSPRVRAFHRVVETKPVTTTTYVPVKKTVPVTTSKIVWVSPVRSAVAKFALPVSRVCGPGGCK